MALNITRQKYSQTDQMIKTTKNIQKQFTAIIFKKDINVIHKRTQKIKKLTTYVPDINNDCIKKSISNIF